MADSLAKLSFEDRPDQVLFRVVEVYKFWFVSEFIEKLVGSSNTSKHSFDYVSLNPLFIDLLLFSLSGLLMEIIKKYQELLVFDGFYQNLVVQEHLSGVTPFHVFYPEEASSFVVYSHFGDLHRQRVRFRL